MVEDARLVSGASEGNYGLGYAYWYERLELCHTMLLIQHTSQSRGIEQHIRHWRPAMTYVDHVYDQWFFDHVYLWTFNWFKFKFCSSSSPNGWTTGLWDSCWPPCYTKDAKPQLRCAVRLWRGIRTSKQKIRCHGYGMNQRRDWDTITNTRSLGIFTIHH